MNKEQKFELLWKISWMITILMVGTYLVLIGSGGNTNGNGITTTGIVESVYGDGQHLQMNGNTYYVVGSYGVTSDMLKLNLLGKTITITQMGKRNKATGEDI